jgi:uncharacterized protein (TIGR03437 family)
MRSCRCLGHGSLLLLLAAFPVPAQFADLAASDDGKILYFTSQMLFHGEQSDLGWPEYRLYRFDAGGVTLFAERGPLASESSFSSSTGVTNVSTTGDGSLVGFTFNLVCVKGGSSCVAPTDEAELLGKQTLDAGEGALQVSRNGRFALLTTTENDEANPGNSIVTITLIDLTSGRRTVISKVSQRFTASNFVEAGNLIASDGTVLTFQVSGTSKPGISYSLWKQGNLTPVPIPAGSDFSPIAISDDASTLIGFASAGKSWQLVTVSVTSGNMIAMTQPSATRPLFLSASNNGQRALYITAPGDAAYVWDAATGATIPVPLDTGEYPTGGTLSGLGGYAFVATTRSRIVTMPVQAGAPATSLFPATPYCDDPGPVAGGSLAELHCTFSLSAAELAGKTSYQGGPLPVVYSRPGNLGVQIPWQWDNFMPKVIAFDIPSPSGFQPSQQLSVWEGAPVMLPADAGASNLFGIEIFKGDWSGPLTTQPNAGDIVNIYMAGLGPVKGDVATGIPAPLDSLRPIQWSLSCQFVPQTSPAEVLFAGLAPGTIGVYQVTLRVPSDSSIAPLTGLQCRLTAGNQSVLFGPGLPTAGILTRGGFSFGFGGPGAAVPPVSLPTRLRLR